MTRNTFLNGGRKMFEKISKMISVLHDSGTLRNPEVVRALADFALSLDDQDYRSQMLGELGVRLAEIGKFDDAERLSRQVENTEKSEFLRRVAEIEGCASQIDRSLRLFSEAREAVLLHRFPTQQALALADIAVSLGIVGNEAQAYEAWDSAVRLAMEAQRAGGTDGPEAAGVLLNAVEAFCKARRVGAAKLVADSILFDSLRERALRTIANASSCPQ